MTGKISGVRDFRAMEDFWHQMQSFYEGYNFSSTIFYFKFELGSQSHLIAYFGKVLEIEMLKT